MRVGSIWQFIGGGISRLVLSAVLLGVFVAVAGVMPWEIVQGAIQQPPAMLASPWLRLGLVIIGLAIIAASLWYNVWSRKQKCIDDVAEQIAWAIHNLLNKPPDLTDKGDLARWWGDAIAWEAKVDRMLENRAFFTRADQLHFGVLGFVDPVRMTNDGDFDDMLAQLKMKFERLRDIINWTQMRRR